MAAFRAFKIGMTSWILPGLLLALIPLITEALIYQRTGFSPCVRIENRLCRGDYNFTKMPNILGHENQDQASVRLEEFRPLMENQCSPHIRFFLCSLLFPMCDPQVKHGIPACREMCYEVRRDCEPYLSVFNLEWPETIQCDKLKPLSSRQCLYPEIASERSGGSRGAGDVHPAEATGDVISDDTNEDKDSDQMEPQRGSRKQKQGKRKRERKIKTKTQETEDNRRKTTVEDSLNTNTEEPVIPQQPPIAENRETEKKEEQNPERFPPNPKWNPVDVSKGSIFPADPNLGGEEDYILDYEPADYNQFLPNDEDKPKAKCKNLDKFVHVEKMNRCLPICDVKIDVMYSSDDKRFACYWMLACALLCIVSSTLTVGTFLVDSKRFRYPERPIIFLSLCYLLYSSAYLVRLGRGPEGSVSCVTKGDSDVKHVVMGDLESTGCTAVFFLLYYFGMAAGVWWVILSVTWFLAAGLKWGHEAIEAHGFYFHLVAWLLPAAQTIVVLVMGKVDGDELTGLCYVGNVDKESLLYFVIVPLTSYLAVGALALGSGFLSLFKIRRVILRKSGEKDAGKLEKLMLKIGIFTVLYIVPTACVVAVNVYQYRNQSIWMAKAEARPCYPPGFKKTSTIPFDRPYRNAPDFPSFDPRSQGYEYDYGSYIPSRPRFTYFSPYDRSQYLNPGSAYNGYRPRYQEPPAPSYVYNPGPYQQDMTSESEPGPRASYDSRPFYTGRHLVEVPPHLNPRAYRVKPITPMRYDPEMARALQAYAGDVDPSFEKGQQANTPRPELRDRDCHLAKSIPSFPIFAIKIFMSLLAGITSGIWIWSGKTYKSWKIFCKSSWCGKKEKEKGSLATSNTPHATSSGNLNGPPSVTSQLLPKVGGRPSPDGEVPNGNRYSYPIISSDRYQGYLPVKQTDDVTHDNDVTRPTTGLTLGDIAREYSDNLESEYRERGEHHHNGTYVTPQRRDDVTDKQKSLAKTKKSSSHTKNNKNRSFSKKARNLGSRDSPTAFISKSSRAIPNVYEDAPSNRGGGFYRGKRNNRDLNGTYHKNHGPTRVRKYSENDANKLSLVSGSGFDPLSNSKCGKAESVNVGTMTCM